MKPSASVIEAPIVSDLRNKDSNDPTQIQMPHLMSKGFGLVPLAVMSNPDVSMGAKGLYAYVASKAESSVTVDIPYADLLGDLHTTRQTFKRYCRELLAAGLMRAYVRRDAMAIGVRDLPYGVVRFAIPRREIPQVGEEAERFMSSKAKPQRSIDSENILETPAKDVMSLGYGLCPQMVFRDSRLEPGAKAIYGYLASFAGAGMTAFPSQQLMLKELNMSRPTYTKHLKQLQAYGYVKVERRKNERNEFTSNIYELVREPEIDDERMEAYSQLRKRTLEASRLRRCASESQGSVEALAEIITSDKTLAAMVAAAIVDNLDAVENSPVSKNFTVEEKPSSEPVSKNFTVDSPVSSFFTNPVSKNFTVVNSVNSNKGQVTDSTYQPTLGCSQVVTGEERETAPSRGKLVGKTTDGFEKLVADSMKPVPQAKLEAVRSAYDNRRSQGYSASDIALAYEAYRASYVAEHKSLKHAKQLDRWLVDGDGLVSYAMMIEVATSIR